MTCGRIAVQVQAPRGLQYPMEFQEPNGHHGKVRHHIALFQKRPHGSEHFRRVGVLARHHAIERKLRFVTPMPRILEGFNLSAGFLASGASKEHVIRCLAVERRIKVHQIHALIVNAAAKNGEVVAVVELAHELGFCPSPASYGSWPSASRLPSGLASLETLNICRTALPNRSASVFPGTGGVGCSFHFPSYNTPVMALQQSL